MKSKTELEGIARFIRRDVFKMALNSGTKGAHIGGSMSAADILAVLYGDVMKYNTDNPEWDGRDRFIMSKAHSSIGLYAALHYAGFLSDSNIESAMQGESILFKHPRLDVAHGLEFSGGSLGQGLALGVGSLLSMKLSGNKTSNVYVMMGDGECDEGSVWEAASSAVHFGLNNLTAIIDRNGLQNDGTTSNIMNLGNMSDRWKSIGFETIEVDGHNVEDIRRALLIQTDKPKAIIAHTIKGKGVSFAENQVEWHIGYFTQEMYTQAMEELK
jgi:transketolase